jgi:hypothetical protein
VTLSTKGWRAPALLACVSLSLGLASCGPKARTVAGGEGSSTTQEAPRPAIEQELPLLRWVPADAETVIVAESLASLEKLSSVVEPLAAAFGFSSEELFTSPWLRQGIDPLGDIVLFTRGQDITLMAGKTAEAATDPGALHTAWTPLGGQSNAAAVTWNMQGNSASGDWLEVMQAAAKGTGFSSLPSAAQSLVGDSNAAIRGHLPMLSLLANAVGGEEFLSCLPLLRAAGGLRLEARLDPDGTARALIEMPLPASSLSAIGAVLGPGASSGLVELRKTEAVHLSLGVDLPKAATAFQEQSCPELAYEIEEILQRLPMSPPPRAFPAVGTRFDTGDLSGSVAVQMPLRSKRFIANQLGRIPGRSFFESNIRVNGHSAKKLSVPTMSSIYYQLSDSQFLFATKKSLMTAILAPASAQNREVAAVGLWPARFPQLQQYLRSAAPSRDVAELWHELLLRFEFAGLTIGLGDDSLIMDLSVRPAH